MSESNKELLSLAAKAHGLPEMRWNDGLEPYSSGQGFIHASGSIWNPLQYDGDAMRLAVNLNMLFSYSPDRLEMFQKFYLEEIDNDLKPPEATRRAIVRVAAEIGKAMP